MSSLKFQSIPCACEVLLNRNQKQEKDGKAHDTCTAPVSNLMHGPTEFYPRKHFITYYTLKKLLKWAT